LIDVYIDQHFDQIDIKLRRPAVNGKGLLLVMAVLLCFQAGPYAKIAAQKYMAALKVAPILVKSVTSGFVYLMGDVFSQIMGSKDQKISDVSKRRMLGSGAAGLLFHGWVSHLWYEGLDHLIEHTLGWHKWWNIFPMVTMDCLLFCPLWNAIYVGFMGLVFGNKVREVAKSVK
jgi:hypothetical protein